MHGMRNGHSGRTSAYLLLVLIEVWRTCTSMGFQGRQEPACPNQGTSDLSEGMNIR